MEKISGRFRESVQFVQLYLLHYDVILRKDFYYFQDDVLKLSSFKNLFSNEKDLNLLVLLFILVDALLLG